MSDLNRRQEEIQRGQAFINEVYQKMSRVAMEFASGEINRTQFHHLYERYQQQALTVAQIIAESDPAQWRSAVSDAESTIHIRKRFAARALGVSIYDNQTGLPIETIGEFTVDPEMIVSMLSSYRQAAAEIFRAGVRSTEMENGSWLCFMNGQYTTLIVLFSLEPAANQLSLLDRRHRDFETANSDFLEHGFSNPDQLAYPFYSFISQSGIRTGSENE